MSLRFVAFTFFGALRVADLCGPPTTPVGRTTI
ncbi:unnamed protein product [Haemonchus placei]|uniref:Uncharacterized protein n=1 Tax=Haemonchus placei TaxID=6290 RepID=A0A3P7SCW1_HAEPC|nr:unnamed protein product [Haemonchus placei]